MRKHHSRWVALFGVTALATTGTVGPATVAHADEQPPAWPVVMQGEATYSLDGYTIGHLPEGLEQYGVNASSSADRQSNRQARISWIQGADELYARVTVVRSERVQDLEDLRKSRYSHLSSNDLEQLTEGEEFDHDAYLSESTGDLFWLEKPGVAITTHLRPERWDSEELVRLAESVTETEESQLPDDDVPEPEVHVPENEDAPEDEEPAEEEEPTEEAPEEEAAEDDTPEEETPKTPDENVGEDELPDEEVQEEEAEDPASENETPGEEAQEEEPEGTEDDVATGPGGPAEEPVGQTEDPAEEQPAEEQATEEQPTEEQAELPVGESAPGDGDGVTDPVLPAEPVDPVETELPEGVETRDVQDCFIEQFIDFDSGESALEEEELPEDTRDFLDRAVTEDELTQDEHDRLLTLVREYGDEHAKTSAVRDCAAEFGLEQDQVETMVEETAEHTDNPAPEGQEEETEEPKERTHVSEDEGAPEADIDPIDAEEWEQMWKSLPWTLPGEQP